ncbi:MAG TPA: hypothetical protein VGK64_28610 [Bryobacteraceae bacterium]
MRAALVLAIVLAGTSVAGASEHVETTKISPNMLVFATSSGNVVASVGPDGALLVGTPSAASTAQISAILAKHTRSATRYVVIYPQDSAHSQGDAGWGQRGAFVAMQEKALDRLGGHAMGAARPLPSALLALKIDRPRIAFSEVLTFDLNGEAIHIIHQAPGYSDADAVTHFHTAKTIYLGEVFPGDGYPEIDPAQGGKLDGLLKQLIWTNDAMHIVPARGKVTTGADVKAFRDMILTVRDRIQKMIAADQTEDQVLAAHPTTDFDARWANGRTRPDAFVRELYSALKTP